MALNNVDLSTYVRVGRYDLPEPKRTTPPINSLLAQEVSAVTYNWDTDTLFVVGDGSTSIVQVSKTGQLINSMTLALGSSPQGTDFYDTEGLTYVGGGQFVLIEERDRQASLFTYTAGTTLTKSNVKTVKLGTTVGNIGIEGISWDPQTNGFIAVKEITPEGIFQTTIDFVAGTASNGSPTTVNSTDLFDPAKAGIADFADVFALSNLSALNGKADSSNILILSQESGKIVKSDRAGNISSSLTIVSDPGNPLSIADQQHEGLTMDKDGYLYVVSENGGGDIDHPQLWVYAPSTVQVDGTEAGKTAVSAGFKGQTIFNTGFIPSGAAGTVNGQQVALGGLSGVTYDAVNNRYYAISDDRSSNARFYTFTLDPVTNAVTFTNVVQLKNINGNPFAVNSLDTEGIALTSNGTILISSEGEVRPDLGASRVTNPFIKEFNLTTGQEIGSLPVPNKFLPVLQDTNNNNVVDTGDTQTSGVRNNLAFESLTITPDQKTLFTATESALFQDGAISTTTTSSRSRIIQYNLVTGQPEKEYLYVTDPIAKSPTGGTAADNGLVDLLAIDNRGTLLALERSFAVGQGNTIKIYEITLQGATDINTVDSLSSLNANQLSAIQPAQKRLLLNLDSLNLPNSDGNHPTGTDNIEGLALGPKLADGTQSIVLVSDNNFSSTQFTQILTLSADVTAINQAPTAVVLNNKISAIAENTSTSPAIKVADITITDDGLGTNTLSLTGTDASSFEITNNGLFIKTGTTLDFETKTSYSVNVNVDDTTVGNTPDATTAFTLAVTDVVNETPTNSSIFITEVAPWSSGNSPVAADWFELTNKGTSAVNITGWKFDDNSNSFASAVALSGITSIGAGESVIFIDGATINTIFRPNWFGANPPASLQIGNYTGSGVGLSTSGDAVNIYNATGVLQANVVFGVSPAGPFATFDNAALLNNATISTLSAAGVNGAFVAVNSNAEIGSPGRINAPATSGITLTQTGGTTNVTEGGATDSYTIVLNSQPTADVAIAINPNSQLTTSAVTLTFTPANWNVAQNVTVTAVDDVLVEGSHSGEITHSVTSTDAQYNNITINPIVVSITDNDISALPTVNLAVSSNTTSESSRNQITVTATASAAVSGNQSITLNVEGTEITPSDYYLSTGLLTILNGQTTATATFFATDDAKAEGTETAVLRLSTPSSGISLGTTTTQNIAITNNSASLTKVSGFTSSNGSEITAFDPISDRLFVVAGSVVEILDLSNPSSPSKIGDLAFDTSGDPDGTTAGGFTLIPNSVAVGQVGTVSAGIVAVAIAITNQTTADDNPGEVQFFNATTGAFISKVNVGFLPDMLTFTPDGTKVLTANEGQPNNAYTTDPVGSVSIINLAGGVATPTVQEASFTAFNSQIDALKASGVRIFGPGSSVAQDFEPEYITFSGNGTKAWVTLQENNAIAVVDIATATVESILPLGVKDYNNSVNTTNPNVLDASDRDVNGTSAGGGKINIQNWPVFGLYQPDAIASYTVNGQTYYVTANEGDTRSYAGFNEEVTVSSLNLDPTAFPDGATLKLNQNLGRLVVTKTLGDTDGDGDYDQIYTFGARSFTIWDSAGKRVYDSGADFERITAAALPKNFNSNNDSNNFDNRSDNKGPEPEGVVIGAIANRVYAFIGLERVGGVMVYEVTNPNSPEFVQYVNTRDFSLSPTSGVTDSGPEGLTFISANDSPNSKPLLVVANETSKTTAIFEVNIPINDAPTLANTIADQTAKQGNAFSFQIPNNTFTDIDAGDVLTYSATLENGDALPSWLTFNSATRTISGTPTNDNVGNLNVKVTATDKAGTSANDIFAIAVENVNDVPTLANTIADQTAKQGNAFSFQIPTNTFTDIDAADVLTYSATSENGNALPTWLTFNTTNRTFSGTPTNDNVGSLNIKAIATDKAGATVSDIFVITVENVNDAPVLKNPLLDQTVKVNSTFTFTLPKDTFSDADAINPYKNLVIFGDSLSDTGNAYKASGNTFPAPPNYQGRFSNGLVWVDYFAHDLQFTDQSIQNYAFVGANTGVSNTFGQITVPGLLTQIQQFKTVNTNSIGKDGLYVIWAGANDFLNLATDPTQAVTSAVTNISSAITILAGLGAKEIVVGNLADLGATPASIASNNVANARAISLGFNTALNQALTNLEPALNVNLSLIDNFGSSTAVQTNPANYKFTNITQPLITATNPVNPDQYAFWDDVHPTTRLHQLVTDTFENTLLNDGVIPDLIKYSATLADGSKLPDWLNFNSTTRTFSGTPNTGNVGKLDVKVIATDKAGATVSDIFTLAVNQSTTVGTPGDDKLIATPGSQFDGQNNIVFTGAGKDEVDLSTVSVFPNSGNNIVDLGSGDDTIYVHKGDRAFGSDGNDTFDARDGQGGNRISGGVGDDTFYLGSNDRALGGDGKDKFYVSLGGGNLISGGAGADQFWIVNAELPSSANTVLDFQLGTDVIGIQGAVSLGITTSTLQLNQVGADTAIVFNNQTLATLTGIQASSLSLTNTNQFVFA
ncbi:choice-of-anchor I family protein [Dolichospermum sp. LEGE 00246]|uniref:choice-of-anchor I family protein n=1 Tax=Dolichospermum sp. LEGE 00246 TaxID=1828605 RepID=UPI001D15A37A|nr:choice-of-anchor I family protein [Dolichospermum sp. LEGE 00246]